MNEPVEPQAIGPPLQIQKHLLLRPPETILRGVADIDIDAGAGADVGADVGADIREAARGVTSQAVNLSHG